jgi:hypothetical protein
MPDTLALLHTAPILADVFTKMAGELSPDILLQHLVDESLLQEARDVGRITPHLNRRVTNMILNAADSGARIIMCTCSSIGPCAEVARPLTSCPVLRVDDPMAREAVSAGGTVVVAATLRSTLDPTKSIVLSAAKESGKTVAVKELLCESAWAEMEKGNTEGYFASIAEDLQRSAEGAQVIVLAQASMAQAAKLCTEIRIPILTSPRSGFLAAVDQYKNTPPVS